MSNKYITGTFCALVSSTAIYKTLSSLDKPKEAVFYGTAATIACMNSYFLYRGKL